MKSHLRSLIGLTSRWQVEVAVFFYLAHVEEHDEIAVVFLFLGLAFLETDFFSI